MCRFVYECDRSLLLPDTVPRLQQILTVFSLISTYLIALQHFTENAGQSAWICLHLQEDFSKYGARIRVCLSDVKDLLLSKVKASHSLHTAFSPQRSLLEMTHGADNLIKYAGRARAMVGLAILRRL